jgi:uncharacterized protein
VNVQRRFAVVTGASRGIGAGYARALAARQYDLLLVSRDKSKLEQLAGELRTSVEVSYEVLDLTESGAGHRLYAATRERRTSVDLLVQNAGFGYYGEFTEMPMPQIHGMLQLHQSTILESTRLFLPDMIERRRGAIIIVASIVGFLPVPSLAEYAASKAFQLQFGRALAEEVRPHGVTIQVCCPGTTDTDFHATAGFRSPHPFGSQSVDRVVSASLAALGGRRTVVTIGWRGRFLTLLSHVVPPSWVARGAARWLKQARANSG